MRLKRGERLDPFPNNGGVVWVLDSNLSHIRFADGPEYGAINNVAEGKIPKSLFESVNIKSISSYYYAGVDSSAGDATKVLYVTLQMP